LSSKEEVLQKLYVPDKKALIRRTCGKKCQRPRKLDAKDQKISCLAEPQIEKT
jgi:hypothetical protein